MYKYPRIYLSVVSKLCMLKCKREASFISKTARFSHSCKVRSWIRLRLRSRNAELECARVLHEMRFIQTKLRCYSSLSAGKFPSVTWQRRGIQPWQLRAKGTITWWDEGLRNFLGHRVLALSVRPAGNADCVNVLLLSLFKTFLRHHLCHRVKKFHWTAVCS